MRHKYRLSCTTLTTSLDAVAKEDRLAAGYAGSSRPAGRRLTTRPTAGDDYEDDERQYEGDGIVGDDEVV
jgi:hypothetical protein